MRILTIIVVTAVISAAEAPAQESLRADRDSIAEAEVEALEHYLIELLQRRDLEAYAPYLAEDYVRVNRRGIVSSKDEALAGFASSSPARQTPSDLDVRVYGDTAILSFVLTSERNGEPPARSRLVKVFVRHGDRWIMVHNQGTALE